MPNTTTKPWPKDLSARSATAFQNDWVNMMGPFTRGSPAPGGAGLGEVWLLAVVGEDPGGLEGALDLGHVLSDGADGLVDVVDPLVDVGAPRHECGEVVERLRDAPEATHEGGEDVATKHLEGSPGSDDERREAQEVLFGHEFATHWAWIMVSPTPATVARAPPEFCRPNIST